MYGKIIEGVGGIVGVVWFKDVVIEYDVLFFVEGIEIDFIFFWDFVELFKILFVRLIFWCVV